MKAKSTLKIFAYGLVVIFALVLPLVLKGEPYVMHLVIMSCVWAVVATNWNLTLGYGGMFHIAQLSFFAVGGYMAAIFITQKSLAINPFLGIFIGGLFAALASLIIGMPALRVKGIYLILLTFAFHYGLEELVNHFREFTGGSMGLVVPKYAIGGFAFAQNTYAFYYLILIILAASVFSTWYLERSHVGLALKSIRDSDVLASVIGVNQYKYKLMTFVFAAFLSGAAGAFYASYVGVIGTEIFSFSRIVDVLGMIVIGGVGTLFGPILGSFIITLFMEVFADMESVRPILVGSVVIACLLFAPTGIIPHTITLLNKRKSKKAALSAAEEEGR